jgi:hypothetical protein
VSTRDFKIKLNEGAIVFKDAGVEFHYPKTGDIELRETFEFLTFAMVKTDWIVEWYEYLSAAEALDDLAGKDAVEHPKPTLTLIEGGLNDLPSEKDKSKLTVRGPKND